MLFVDSDNCILHNEQTDEFIKMSKELIGTILSKNGQIEYIKYKHKTEDILEIEGMFLGSYNSYSIVRELIAEHIERHLGIKYKDQMISNETICAPCKEDGTKNTTFSVTINFGTSAKMLEWHVNALERAYDIINDAVRNMSELIYNIKEDYPDFSESDIGKKQTKY